MTDACVNSRTPMFVNRPPIKYVIAYQIKPIANITADSGMNTRSGAKNVAMRRMMIRKRVPSRMTRM